MIAEFARQQGRMNNVRIVGVKLQQIEEMPEHPRHFGFRQLNARRASQLLKHTDYRFGPLGFRRPRAQRFSPQSSSTSRFAAGATGFLILSHWSTRPEQ